MARTCIFCRTSGKMSKEHIIPEWLNKQLSNGQESRYTGTHFAPLFSHEISTKHSGPNSHTLKRVCLNCNHGWMSELESRFKNLLPKLIQNISAKSYTKTERHTIASWVFKTALIDHYGANYRTILPIELAHEFFNNFHLPKTAIIHVGRFKNTNRLKTMQSPFHKLILPEAIANSMNSNDSTFQYSICFHNLFFRLSWHKFSSKKHRPHLISQSENQFYPHPKNCSQLKTYEDVLEVGTNIYLSTR